VRIITALALRSCFAGATANRSRVDTEGLKVTYPQLDKRINMSGRGSWSALKECGHD
jgi:hypothetical protein